MRGEEVGLAAGRHEDGRAGPGDDRGDRRREARPGDTGPIPLGADPPPQAVLERVARQPLDEDRLGSPQRLEPVDLDLEQPERGIERLGAAGDPRAERGERLERGLELARSASGSGSRKVASGTSRCALPSGIPRRTPSARASGLASMTGPGHHGRPPRMSGPAGKGSEVAPSGEFEREMWSVEMEKSHRVGPFGFRGGEGGGIGRGLVGEEVVAGEAGVALTALRVEDPEGRPPARRAVAVAGDQHLRSLADDVASEPDPRSPGELEPDPGRLGDGGREATGEPGRLEDDEERLRPPGEGGQPAESIGDPGGLVRRQRDGRRAGR